MKYLLYLVCGLGLMFGSCKKFLAEIPTGSLTDQSAITSAPGGTALATGSYRALSSWTNGAVAWGGNLPASLEYATGKAYSQVAMPQLWKFETNVISGDIEYFYAQWNNWYRGVRDCNLAMKLLPGVSGLTAYDKSKLLGEVRTLRAYYYFCLVRYYGDVVYNTEVLEDINMASRPRTSLKAIYDRIIVPDLEFAVNESQLVDGRSTNGRVSKYVARTILADVYLTMAGYPYQEVNADPDTTKQWCTQGLWKMTQYPVNTQNAKDLLQKAKTQLDFLYEKYPIGEFSDLNNPQMNNKGGAIFQIQFLSGSVSNGAVAVALPLASLTSVFGGEFGSFVPSLEYHNSYSLADKRIQDRVYFYYNDTKSLKYDINESPAGKFPLPFLYKYYDYNAIKFSGSSGLNFNLYRYADVLLMLTEVNWSLNELGVAQPETDITKGINEVRARASLGSLSASSISVKNIMAERAYELIFENKMLWDMRRTRKALVDGSGEFSSIVNFVGHQPTSFNYQFSVKDLLTPVSSVEIDNNRQCLQNFGWTPKQVGQ